MTAEPYESRSARVVTNGGDTWSAPVARATSTWQEGLTQFPDNAALKARLSKQGDDLKALFDAAYDPNKRVDTSLKDLWTE